jgi:hypothetical protein
LLLAFVISCKIKDMYQEIIDKLVEKGFSEETASRLAEFINDAGWDTVRDALNEISDAL